MSIYVKDVLIGAGALVAMGAFVYTITPSPTAHATTAPSLADSSNPVPRKVCPRTDPMTFLNCAQDQEMGPNGWAVKEAIRLITARQDAQQREIDALKAKVKP